MEGVGEEGKTAHLTQIDDPLFTLPAENNISPAFSNHRHYIEAL